MAVGLKGTKNFPKLKYLQLCEAFGKRLREIRGLKGLSAMQATSELKVAVARYRLLESGKTLPEPEELHRIIRWSFGGFKYKYKCRPVLRRNLQSLFKFVKVGLWKTEYEQINLHARMMGMGIDEFIEFCVYQQLKDTVGIMSMRQAASDYSTAKAIHALKQGNLGYFIQSDLNMVTKEAKKIWEQGRALALNPERQHGPIDPEWFNEKVDEMNNNPVEEENDL